MSVIKQSINLISIPIAHIMNLSINHGIVPNEMKIARVIPLFKSGDYGTFTNYRPVSILPSFSKFLERIIYNRLINYIDKNKQHSTSLALIDIYDKISTSIDSKEYAVGIFLDLSKAFDTVNHTILLDKLEYYGIRGLSLNWFKSYLSNRLQFVEFNGCCSCRKLISCGVPQGSIIGPLLFLLYINDLSTSSNILKFVLFADDTNIFFSGKDLCTISTILNTELEKISTWLEANILSLNLDKTKFMLFRTRKKQVSQTFNLYIDNHLIEQTKEIRLLGVILDEVLSWKSHISYIANKISKSVGIIYRSSFYLSKSSLRSLYYSMIYPYLYYCNIVWASTYKSNLHRIVILQKRVIRIMNRAKYDAHSDPIFKDLEILKFEQIHLLQLGLCMFSFKKFSLPEKCKSMFTLNDQLHSYNTRSSSKFHLPLCASNIRKFSVQFQGPKFFNSLPVKLTNCLTIFSFKTKLRYYLINLE